MRGERGPPTVWLLELCLRLLEPLEIGRVNEGPQLPIQAGHHLKRQPQVRMPRGQRQHLRSNAGLYAEIPKQRDVPAPGVDISSRSKERLR